MNRKQTYVRALQLSIAFGLVTFLFLHIDISKIKNLIYQAIPLYMILAFLTLSGQMVVAAYRWFLVMRLAGFSLPIWQCINSFAVSSLINTTLPVAIGGDIMRMWVTTRNNVPTTIAVYTVLYDRILNTLGLALLVILVMATYLAWTPKTMCSINILALNVSILLTILFVALIFLAPTVRRLQIRVPAILSPVINLSEMSRLILKNPYQLFILSSVIMLGHFMLVIATMLLAYGLQVPLSFTHALIAIPITLLFSAFPITPGGWGVREGTMVLALAQFNVPAEIALGISILFGFGSIFGSIPASLAWFVSKNSFNKPAQPIASNS